MSRLFLLSFFLVGCISAYASRYSGPSSLEPADSFECIHSALADLNYSVTDANRDAGFIKARTNEPVAMRLTGEPLHDELTVSIIKTDGGSELRISTVERATADKLIERCR